MITKNYDTLPQCAKDIRINVFINEQGFQEEFDELDGISNHLVTFDGDKPCATVRFYEQDGIYYIGRLAVLKEYRSHHLGAKTVNEAEKIIKEKGMDVSELSYLELDSIWSESKKFRPS